MRHTWSEWSLITAAVICRVRLSSGDRSLPRACTLVSSWVQGGSVERRVLHPRDGWRARMPGRIPPEATRAKRRTKPLKEAAEPRAPDPRGERVRPPDSAPLPGPFLLEHCPSFTNPAARRGHQIPCLFWTLHPLWTLFYYFYWIKASPRPGATPTVSVVCSSHHNR